MADYSVPRGTRIERNKDGDSGNYLDGFVSHSIVARELHLEVNLANVTKELSKLLISKHKDYGPKNISQAPGGAINGLRVRMHDKLARINNLIDSGASPEHESLEDSFKDMANYAIIGLLVLRGKWDE
jgi:hypothetical protein